MNYMLADSLAPRPIHLSIGLGGPGVPEVAKENVV